MIVGLSGYAQSGKDTVAKYRRVERDGVKAVNSHVSEHDLDGWEFDAYIHNNATIEDLEFAVKSLMVAVV